MSRSGINYCLPFTDANNECRGHVGGVTFVERGVPKECLELQLA